jgi:hypothetical protein
VALGLGFTLATTEGTGVDSPAGVVRPTAESPPGEQAVNATTPNSGTTLEQASRAVRHPDISVHSR